MPMRTVHGTSCWEILAGGRVLVMCFGFTKTECWAHGRLGLPLQATTSQWQLTMPDV